MATNSTGSCPPGIPFNDKDLPTPILNQTQCGLAVNSGGLELLRTCCDKQLYTTSQVGSPPNCIAGCSGGRVDTRADLDIDAEMMRKCMRDIAQRGNISAGNDLFGLGCHANLSEWKPQSGAAGVEATPASVLGIVLITLLLGRFWT